jgi:hypothetical protein
MTCMGVQAFVVVLVHASVHVQVFTKEVSVAISVTRVIRVPSRTAVTVLIAHRHHGIDARRPPGRDQYSDNCVEQSAMTSPRRVA